MGQLRNDWKHRAVFIERRAEISDVDVVVFLNKAAHRIKDVGFANTGVSRDHRDASGAAFGVFPQLA